MALVHGWILFQGIREIKLDVTRMVLRQTANGKNETFAVCLYLFERKSENISICGE